MWHIHLHAGRQVMTGTELSTGLWCSWLLRQCLLNYCPAWVPPPAQLHPQLQRLPNGYSLISALWSSTAPLGRGLERLQECACMSVFILHCFSICTVTGEHPLTQASSELFITDCTVLPGNTVTPTDIWHFTVVCRVSHLMYGSAKSFLLRMSEAFIMFVDHKISIILRNILHPLNITL